MVELTETVLRDGHQSLIATRMRTRDMLPAVERLDAVGYRSLEVWGGATFDVCLRYLHEDPWERLREIKRRAKRTPLQMLLRGQNLVGYRHYPDDVVERFCARAAKEGVDLFRVFDALNDPRNMRTAVRAIKKAGGRVQGTICYTESPVHTQEAFVSLGRELAEMGSDELCIKDMGGFMPPHAAAALVSALKKEIGLPIAVHTHSSSGMALMALLASAEAGATSLDTALSPFGGGTSQPPTESVVGGLRGTPFATRLSLEPLADLADYFQGVLERYRPMLEFRSLQVDPQVLLHQVPGGMLSNLFSQLREQDALGRLPEVLKEVPRVREDLGYPPLVTPTSQIVGIQAVFNVLLGQRYKEITKEVRDYVKGLYGHAPGPISSDLQHRVLDGAAPLDGRPADLLAPEYERIRSELSALLPAATEEEVLSYAIFPQVFKEYLVGRSKGYTAEMLTVAAAGVLAALRAPTVAAAPPSTALSSTSPTSSVAAPSSGWALAGRIRSMDPHRWQDAYTARRRR
ncbi:MAG: pyruvate carboxylase subunit B [Euryarchaeota archaeon]|nr:pyruvate carboxylase subunit B [Euryarchaeota archaeon]MDE1836078.1 pyruvate carboxylase subunit B [Euryarchaeota archaeon]MDE1879974.1 pyruvate carboxylase subunit B [Euryarchaeota archaeon]MDE2044056.1 pyruvate carboxylase subunit B [Thermoplasmata archaeon]